MNMHSHRQAPWLSITFAVFAIDQGTKSYIDATTSLGWSQAVTSFFNLVQVLNPGAAFSFLVGAGDWQRWFFLAFALAASARLSRMLRHPRPRMESLTFGMILGAALGNAVGATRLVVASFAGAHQSQPQEKA